MNNIMKTLTVFSTIFMPLTFIAGVYGMNFTHMPELGGQYSYFICLLIMALIGGMMAWFYKKDGLSKNTEDFEVNQKLDKYSRLIRIGSCILQGSIL